MLQKQYRLPATTRLSRGQSFTSPLFLCKLQQNNLPVSRFGFVVRKTIDKRATVRNRIRRVFRSCIEALFPQIKPGYDVLFLLHRGLLEIDREELYNTLYGFLKEKRLLS